MVPEKRRFPERKTRHAAFHRLRNQAQRFGGVAGSATKKIYMKRDLYIDFAKGFATISIIFIHTAFWSGQFYLPTEVRVFSLVFDL